MAFILLIIYMKENINFVANKFVYKKKNPSNQKDFLLLKYYQEEKLDDAEKLASSIVKEYPNNFFAWKALGVIYHKKNKKTDSLKSNLQALKLDPNDAEILNNLGVAFNTLGRAEEAYNVLVKALLIKKNYAEAHYNLGCTLKVLGRLKDAEKSLVQAIKINPNHVLAYNNLGIIHKEEGRLSEAITSLSNAIRLDPNCTEPYNNLGVILLDIGKVKETIPILERAIKNNPKYFEAYNNLGSAYLELGNIKKAITCFIAAIRIKPNYIQAWNNIYFPLQIVKSQKNCSKYNLFYNLDPINTKTYKVNQSLLTHKLNLGGSKSELYLEKAINAIPDKEETSISNINPLNSNNQRSIINSKEIIALHHFGRSGTGLLHSLIDNHSEVSTLPSIYLSEFFDEAIWSRIISDGWSNVIDNFIATYPVLFDSRSSVPVPSINRDYNNNFGIKEGMTTLGKNKDEFINIDKILFKKELNRLTSQYKYLDQITFFRLLHEAYEKASKGLNDKKILFYHIHNPDIYAKLNFLKSSPNTKYLVMVREPVDCCESWIYEPFNQDSLYRRISTRIITMLFDIDKVSYKGKDAVGLRLEDLKNHPKKTISVLCNWMQIKEESTLYEMTAQGKKWWGGLDSKNMSAFGKVNKSKIGKIFSEKDRFVFKTLFYPFSIKFEYEKENAEKFKDNLKKIRPMIDEIFDFEKQFIKRTELNKNEFKKSAMYLYMRTRMIERWEVLNKFNTYPNMLKYLKIK